MINDHDDNAVPMLETPRFIAALRFAAEKHRDQRRKGTQAPPYVNHLIEVAFLLVTVGGVTDDTTLVAAVLHDTVEDTDTRPTELEHHFGEDVRLVVAEVTDDKSLPKQRRKELQVEHAPTLSSRAKLVKLGDKISNVREVVADMPTDWTVERTREYLEWAKAVVDRIRGTNHALERHFDDVYAAGVRALEKK